MSAAPGDLPGLPAGSRADSRERLHRLAQLLATDAAAPSSVRGLDRVLKVHIADSLSGLEAAPLAAVARADDAKPGARIGDVGSGAGLPGLVLAAILPCARVDLIEATSRKCEFLARAVNTIAATNATVVCERAETWAVESPVANGRESYDVVTARAVGRLAMLAELASPLLRPGGALVAWKGERDGDEEAELERAADALAMRPVEVLGVVPYAESQRRHLHVVEKCGPTPAQLPRRPGMAKKRALRG